jgi:RNA polymerase sigma-70 factor, ECF subfamily
MQSDSPDDLMCNVRNGDSIAFEQLVEAIQHKLYDFLLRRVANRECAADLFQETIMRLWKHRASYQPGQCVVAYMLRIAHRLILDNYSRQRRQSELIKKFPRANDVSAESNPEVTEALNSLPEPERSVLVLCGIYGLKYRDVAEALELTERAVEYRLSNAIESMRRILCRS